VRRPRSQRRPDQGNLKQVQAGLAAAADGGIPVFHHAYDGGTGEVARVTGAACDFTEFFEVSQPTVSAHLKALREAGLVTTQRRGNTICPSLASARLSWLAVRLASTAAKAPASVSAR
jgi:DNA-binding transcriptional ArsR family regulator